jgi:hypothetical protein
MASLMAILLVGCGPDAPFELRPRGFIVRAELPLVAESVAYNIDLSADVLQKLGPKITPAEFDEAFRGLEVTVRDDDLWPSADGKRQIRGWTQVSPFVRVEVDRNMTSLAHELEHVWQWQHGITNTADHPDWDANGYNTASLRYASRRVVVR